MTDERAVPGAAESVRPLELFFDLVFVFTITQVASILVAAPTLLSTGRVAVLLVIIWWMYSGYAWLTNALDLERTGPRLLLLAGTAGFFLMAMAVPKAVGQSSWALVFGAGYLLVVSAHLVGFIGTSGHRGIVRVGPLNLASALVVLAAGAVPAQVRLWLWALAAVMEVVTPLVTGTGGFAVGVGHFVERHGLAVIIVLGESITEVGAATSQGGSVGTAVVGALLALVLSAQMWWLYFGREDRESQARLERVPLERRPRVAVHSFGYAYYLIILGIVVAAVGMEKAIDEFHRAPRQHDLAALLLPLGISLYLVGLACFHRALAGDWPRARIAAALAVAALVTPAALRSGGAALAAAALVLFALILREGRRHHVAGVGIGPAPS
ncbi:low temperature requirement protein A [Kitasatospora sp. NBC_01287]|uniref:low temperature requirement protein A n=1 Tax=Kitasatospora sp. NBC_01287 TaxID=2903573 RepID=UPI0022524912|nr:low temperature requirement protein A [Kitasatospora sp. NBC_01287]MCX4744029.1 low temperature requirement protein A [Kitasatospora sp. NBC_01287]